jgi:hypothetical protein
VRDLAELVGKRTDSGGIIHFRFSIVHGQFKDRSPPEIVS